MVPWKATNVDNYLGMDLEDRFLIKVSEVQSLSSSVHSTPEKNGHSDDASRSPEFFQDFLKSGPRRELLRTCHNMQKINSAFPKRKMSDKSKLSNKAAKTKESRRSSCVNPQPSRKKQSRKGDNPKRLTERPQDFGSSNLSTICRNSACRRVLSMHETSCKRCSCYFCRLFDDNKDPSLWLACPYECGERDKCGYSCHIECALQNGKVGVVNLGPSMQLDGGYCCASCGTVSGVLNCWKNQLQVAKNARRLDVLCHRIYLSHRLLNGTSKFKELHEIVKDAKATLERETGPVTGSSAKMVRGLVCRLSVANDVQKLCSLAVEKADEWLANSSDANPVHRGDSHPASCRFIFEEVTSSSVVILVINLLSSVPDNLKGYKVRYYKTRGEISEPLTKVVQKNQRRIPISELQPGTEYTFCVAAYTEGGEVGCFEANCFTKSIELTELDHDAVDHERGSLSTKEQNNATRIGSSGCQVSDPRTLLLMAEPREQGGSFKGRIGAADMNGCSGDESSNPEGDNLLSAQQGLDLNIATVPDLNDEIMPPSDFSKGEEDNSYALENGVEDNVKDINRSNGGHFFHAPAGKGTTTIDFLSKLLRKRAEDSKKETHECNRADLNESNGMEDSLEHCVKTIRWLECEGYISPGFRLKLLTWFSMRSTQQERRVVHTFVRTLMDDPVSLAGQLVDTFSEVISAKKPKNGFCGKLWH